MAAPSPMPLRRLGCARQGALGLNPPGQSFCPRCCSCHHQSLLSPVAFGFGCEYFSLYEEQGVGIQWHNLGASPVPGDPYNFATAMGLLLLDASLYGLATWYLEGVFPGERGPLGPWQPPWSWPCSAPFCCRSVRDPQALEFPLPEELLAWRAVLGRAPPIPHQPPCCTSR